MSKKSPISLEVNLHAVVQCLQNKSNQGCEAKLLGVDGQKVTDWMRKYKVSGLKD